jgi:hypothetical protein
MNRERDVTGTHARVLASDAVRTEGQIASAQGADPDRLLEGEDPETLQVHDAEHWIRVYQDLLAFKRQLLATANEMVTDMDDAARDEVGKTDIIAMDAEAGKFQRRLQYWQQRRDELGATQ